MVKKNSENMSSCFHPIPESYGRTDRRKDRQNSYINIARQYTDARSKQLPARIFTFAANSITAVYGLSGKWAVMITHLQQFVERTVSTMSNQWRSCLTDNDMTVNIASGTTRCQIDLSITYALSWHLYFIVSICRMSRYLTRHLFSFFFSFLFKPNAGAVAVLEFSFLGVTGVATL